MMARNKYNAQKTEINGIIFDSKREAERYLELLALQQAGEITLLEIHPRFELQQAFKDSNGKRQRAITYEADFEYMDNNYTHTVEDVKGFETDVFKIKKKIFMYQYPFIDFRIVR